MEKKDGKTAKYPALIAMMSDTESPCVPMFGWRWVLTGNGPLSVLSMPNSNGRFHRHGTSFYHFVTGSVLDEQQKYRDMCNRIFVKIGICCGCFNAGPAGMICEICQSADDCPAHICYGAIRTAHGEERGDVAEEIDPLHVVQQMDRSVLRVSAAELALHFGPAAQQPQEDENRHYFVWSSEHEKILQDSSDFVHNRPVRRSKTAEGGTRKGQKRRKADK